MYLRVADKFEDRGRGNRDTGIWGRIAREQPDKPGVVSVDRISGGLLEACVETRGMNN